MPVIDARVNANEALAALGRMASRMQDLTPANKGLAAQLDSFVNRNFKSSGMSVGGWAPLRPSTLKRKQRKGYSLQPLITTGQALTLQRSFLPFYDSRQAGIGTEVPYSIHHEQGRPGKNLPARPMLPSVGQGLEMGVRVYGHFIRQAQRGAGL